MKKALEARVNLTKTEDLPHFQVLLHPLSCYASADAYNTQSLEFSLQHHTKIGLVADACNPSIQKVQAGE